MRKCCGNSTSAGVPNFLFPCEVLWEQHSCMSSNILLPHLLDPAYFTRQCDHNYYRNYDNILCLYILLCYYYRCCSIVIIINDSLGAAYIVHLY